MPLDHHKLEVYRVAREVARDVHLLMKQAPRRRPDLIDQLNRAVASMVLNIAEGAGEFRPKEKARFYRMSRRSADEASTVLDLLVDVEVLTAPNITPVQQKIEGVIGRLVRLIQNQELRVR